MLNDKNIACFIIIWTNTPIGTVRFNRLSNDQASMHIYLNPPEVGRGRGRALIEGSINIVRKRWPKILTIFANIKKNNKRSILSFQKAGFKEILQDAPGKKTVKYTINI